MSPEYKVLESTLYGLWQKQILNTPLKTVSGDDIAILDAGSLNDDSSGPDFKNARIRIGNLTYVGDIEIDRNYSDWKNHGHNIDNKYNKVVLHATLLNKSNNGYVYTRNGRKVVSICLSEVIPQDKLNFAEEKIEETESKVSNYLKCCDLSSKVNYELKEKFLSQLGIERFNKKCKKVYERLKELQFIKELNIKEPVIAYELNSEFHNREFKHTDFVSKNLWQQLFYELIFEALGYSKNKGQMSTLAQNARVEFFEKIENDGVIIDKFEAALLYIAGLAQSTESVKDRISKEYSERIMLNWNSIKPFYDGKYMDESQWHFFRLRPQNFPTIRIAAGARILKDILHSGLINIITRKITEIHNLTVLINSLRSLFVIRSSGYWKNHYVFDQPANNEIKYFVGASRADEIIVNVVLPFFSVYFEVFGNKNLSKKVLKIYSIYEQRAENQIIHDVAASLKLENEIKKTIISQGMIEVFRSYCSKNKCLECEIGKAAFN